MNYLFIDTHSDELQIAVITNSSIYSEKRLSDRSHSEIAIPTLEELLKKSSVSLEKIDEIIVVNGPGSFTGVRIGVTIAKTIAYSLNIKIKTITSLEAFGLSEKDSFDLITVKDSKGVYSVLYENNEFKDFSYRKNSDFEEYVSLNDYKVSENKTIDFDKLLKYMESKPLLNPHAVNPIYIKEIDVLK